MVEERRESKTYRNVRHPPPRTSVTTVVAEYAVRRIAAA